MNSAAGGRFSGKGEPNNCDSKSNASTAACAGLKEWIEGALASIDTSDDLLSSFGADPRSIALSSDEYILNGLRVARCLAEQVFSTNELNELLATIDIKAECVLIYLPDDDEPLPFSPKEPSSASENKLPSSLSYFDDEPSNAGGPNGSGRGARESEYKPSRHGGQQRRRYLPVSTARFRESDNADFDIQTDLSQIHNLGLIFFELFSGGDKFRGRMLGLDKRNIDSDLDTSLHLLDSITGDTAPDAIDDFDSLLAALERQDDHGDQVKPRKRVAPHSDSSSIGAAVMEQLKSKRLPSPLCELIANMIDSNSGFLAKDGSYTQLSDVIMDLKLFTNEPRVFLDGLDLAQIPMGLPISETTFGRETELAQLSSAYDRSVSDKTEASIIFGHSGTGKSVLAYRLGATIQSRGGTFISGKFDFLQQRKPFLAVGMAFNQYCEILVEQGKAATIGCKLRSALGDEIVHLVQVIPKLSNIISDSACAVQSIDNAIDPGRRLLHLFTEFVRIIAETSDMALFLDDLQWADTPSLEVIRYLITSDFNTRHRFFFLGCCRQSEVAEQSPLMNLISDVTCQGVRVMTIELTRMDEELTNRIVSRLLQLSPRLTKDLAHVVFKKTNGLPLFFSQLLMALSRNKSLQPSLSRQRWEWDITKIETLPLPRDVATFLESNITRLPQHVQEALITLAFFGSRTDSVIIRTLERVRNVSLCEPLEIALAEGLIERRGGQYCFLHDSIQESCYNRVDEPDRPPRHYEYGMSLSSFAMNSSDDSLLLIAADQINRGGPMALDSIGQTSDRRKQAYTLAELNLQAGIKAMKMSNFDVAFEIFDHGINFLRADCWQGRQYNLTLKLYNNAAKCSLYKGDSLNLKLLCNAICKFAKHPDDTLDSSYYSVGAISKINPQESLDMAIGVLGSIGEVFPDSYDESDIRPLFHEVNELLSDHTDASLLALKPMTDPRKRIAMRFLGRINLLALLARPNLQPVLTIKMIRLTLAHGISPHSSIGFAAFGLLHAKLVSIPSGYRWTKLARRLLDKNFTNDVAGDVYHLTTQLACFVEPLQSANETFLQSYSCSMLCGDVNNAIQNMLVHAVGSFWCGLHLDKVKDNFEASACLAKKFGYTIWLSIVRPLQRTALTLAGVDERDLPSEVTEMAKLSPFSALLSCFNRMMKSYYFRDLEQTRIHAMDYFELSKDLKSWTVV